MKASKLIELLQKTIEKYGDLNVVSTGYYGDREVESLKVGEEHTWGDIILLPGSFP